MSNTNTTNIEWHHDEAVRSALEKFIQANKWTHAKMAGKLNFSATRVTKYLNLDKAENTPEVDAPRVEAAARQFLRHVSRLNQINESLFNNSVSANTGNVLKLIRKTGDVGLLHSNGGKGKTSGCLLYCRDNPNTLFLTAKEYASGSHAMARMLFTEYCAGSAEEYPGNLSRAEWLESQLRGAERLIIVDDAELMDISGFKFFFSLHDATGVAIAFVGNTQVIEKIRRQDPAAKMISRIGIVHEVVMAEDAGETARKLIEQFAPESGDELVELATDVVSQPGYARRLRKQLTLAANIKEGSAKASWANCFESAAGKLISAKLQVGNRLRNRERTT
jgi:hypothetical protein